MRLATNFCLRLEKKKKGGGFRSTFWFPDADCTIQTSCSFQQAYKWDQTGQVSWFYFMSLSTPRFQILMANKDNKIKGSPCNYYSLELAESHKVKKWWRLWKISVSRNSLWQAKVITYPAATTALSDALSIWTSLLACLNFTYLCLDYFGQPHPLSLHLHPKAPPPIAPRLNFLFLLSFLIFFFFHYRIQVL